jgi:hypothetical protein
MEKQSKYLVYGIMLLFIVILVLSFFMNTIEGMLPPNSYCPEGTSDIGNKDDYGNTMCTSYDQTRNTLFQCNNGYKPIMNNNIFSCEQTIDVPIPSLPEPMICPSGSNFIGNSDSYGNLVCNNQDGTIVPFECSAGYNLGVYNKTRSCDQIDCPAIPSNILCPNNHTLKYIDYCRLKCIDNQTTQVSDPITDTPPPTSIPPITTPPITTPPITTPPITTPNPTGPSIIKKLNCAKNFVYQNDKCYGPPKCLFSFNWNNNAKKCKLGPFTSNPLNSCSSSNMTYNSNEKDISKRCSYVP